ncbi:uncharacterized protein BJ171DRAFT_496948 [Polychytrium aggregatum]|uniref:uncharacterized protein n=1 Tax=Polychytrium aggregatum TaxID=110093 RepID=UPI0022FE7410|nr:uncharacterized protein BJ171DRAFT_496948 [Polychytrium aggregatum]KAI9206780.1 hypothetical protein BJ171DRAFT_496948 [Polychytrium aggregatum]
MIPPSKFGRVTLWAVLVEGVIITALESTICALLVNNAKETPLAQTSARGIPVYLVIFIFAQLFQIILCWDAVWHKNTIQIIGLILFNLCICGYSIFQYTQILSAIQTIFNNFPSTDLQVARGILLSMPVIAFSFQFVLFFLGWRLYKEYGWKIYKTIGADPKMRTMYRYYQIMLLLLKLDVFFVFGFGIQYVVLILDPTSAEFYLTVIMFPIMMVLLAAAVYAIRKEDKVITYLFLLGLALGMGYLIFKIVRISTDPSSFLDTAHFLTFFASISLMLCILTFINAIICLRSFGCGMKQHLSSRTEARDISSFPSARNI